MGCEDEVPNLVCSRRRLSSKEPLNFKEFELRGPNSLILSLTIETYGKKNCYWFQWRRGQKILEERSFGGEVSGIPPGSPLKHHQVPEKLCPGKHSGKPAPFPSN